MAAARNSKLLQYLSAQYQEFDDGNVTPRLRSLYSDFSKLALTNEYGYEANVAYWRAVILDCNRNGLLGTTDYQLAIRVDEIADRFRRSGIGKPLALDCVVVGETTVLETFY